MAARNSLNVLKYRGLKLECAWRCVSYFHPSVTKKVCWSKRNQLTHQRSFEPGQGEEATSQSCFESMGKKT